MSYKLGALGQFLLYKREISSHGPTLLEELVKGAIIVYPETRDKYAKESTFCGYLYAT